MKKVTQKSRMDSDKKIVSQIPLTNLWTDKEVINARREKYLTKENIQEIIKKYPVEFVIADVGNILKWISPNESFDFWKTEIRPNLANDINDVRLDRFFNNYAYIASEWRRETEVPIILLEKYH